MQVAREDVVNILTSQPEQCPLATKKGLPFGIILHKLKESLSQFKCSSSDSQGAVDLLKSNIDELSVANKKYSGGRGPLLDEMKVISGVFDGFFQLAKNGQCRNDLQRRGFLQTLSDTILNVTRLGLLSDDGLDIFFGGMLISSTLRLLDHLFYHKKYNWNDHEDRYLFTKLNCAFYDIRQELEQSAIFLIGDEGTRKQEQQLREKLQNLTNEKRELVDKLANASDEKTQAQQAFLRERQTASKEGLYEYAQKFAPDLTSATTTDQWLSGKLLPLTLEHKQILSLIDAIAWQKEVNDHLVPVVVQALTRLSIENYVSNISTGSQDFLVVGKFLAYYKKFYWDRLLAVEAEWEQSTQLMTLNESFSKWQHRLGEVEVEIKKKSARLNILIYRNSQGQYLVDDTGVATLASLYQYYRIVASNIYGKEGRSFIKKIKSELRKHYKNFLKGDNSFKKKNYLTQESFSAFELDIACGHAGRLIKTWGEANTWGQYAFDFVMTNLNISHNAIEQNLLRGQREKVMLEDAYSALYAKALIDKHRGQAAANIGITPLATAEKSGEKAEESTMIEAYQIRNNSLGDWMVKIYEELERVKQLGLFVEGACKELTPASQ